MERGCWPRIHIGSRSVDATSATWTRSLRSAPRWWPVGDWTGWTERRNCVPSPLESFPLDQLRHQLEVNLVGQLAVIQAVLPALLSAQGRIVVVGSIGDRVALPMLGAYHASKFGLLGLTDSLGAELAPSGVHVVLIEPGMVSTRIWSTGAPGGTHYSPPPT